MLSKYRAKAGEKILVKDNRLKDGMGQPIAFLTLNLENPKVGEDAVIPIRPGTILEMLDYPKKYYNYGVHYVHVTDGAHRGFMFWHELRVSCDFVGKVVPKKISGVSGLG